MKKILAIALVALIALSTIFAGGSSEKASVDKLTKIKESGKLVVINNSDREQTTTIPTEKGDRTVTIAPYDTVFTEI